MEEALRKALDRFEELDQLLSDPEVVSDPSRSAVLMKERGRLSKLVTPYCELLELRRQLEQAREVAGDPSSEPELRELAQEELAEGEEREKQLLAVLEELLLTADEESDRSVIVEVRAGTGGEEAALFAAELFRMYVKMAEGRGWKVEVMDSSETDLGGIRSVTFAVEGADVYRYLRYESGTHRVQRVPRTEAQGRIHTSACTVAVLPQAEEVEVQVKPSELKIEFFRSSGPGGQNVNKVSTAVRLIHLPTDLRVECQTERSQHKNRELAMKLLRGKLYEQQKLQQKSERDRLRRSQIGSGDRSEKIRTYNFPQSRVTDHRIGFSLHSLPQVLDGELWPMIEKLQQADRQERLKNFKPS